ncbi:ABC transporter permease [Haloferax gibbonsii]|uniref:Uncharacterized protein n=1 Tax=Haloferax gibbonsii TaxID=35746 RepID=A0A0K1IYG8_HALGI|nr:ABC transporter permease [Haloferax gibbonsii]AKU09360.1 hypothetical protein ABY42_16310 [Haloferax gibbonsii]
MLTEVFAVAGADFRERSRTVKWLVVPVVLAYFAKLITVDASLIIANEYTGVPTAAWYGAMLSAIGTISLFVFGYVLVGGSVVRDRTTGIDQLVATSSISDSSYLLGKTLSNFALLTMTTLALALLTGATFVIQGTGGFDIWALFSPFLLVTLPTMTIVAAGAVCFECNRFLRGTAGNIIYVFGAILLTLLGAHSGLVDIAGIHIFRESMGQAIAAQYPSFDGTDVGFFYTNSATELSPFAWSGVTWTASHLLTRAPIFGLTAALLLASYISFNRFDETGLWSLPQFSSGDTGGSDEHHESSPLQSVVPGAKTSDSSTDPESLPPVSQTGVRFPLVFLSELRLAVRGQPRWWYVACVLAFLGTFVPSVTALRSVIIPIALLLPLSLWSHLATRDQTYRTRELVFVTSGRNVLLASTYLAAVVVGIALTVPAAVRFAISSSFGALFGWAVGVLFIPAVALAIGVWTGRPRVFEMLYLVAWYGGPMNNIIPLDYLGVYNQTISSGVTFAYLGLTVVALGAAFVGRHRSLNSG